MQVIYQILATVFPEESDIRLRTCWPTDFERKRETEYRKVAFGWVLEISEVHTRIFFFMIVLVNCNVFFFLFVLTAISTIF